MEQMPQPRNMAKTRGEGAWEWAWGIMGCSFNVGQSTTHLSSFDLQMLHLNNKKKMKIIK